MKKHKSTDEAVQSVMSLTDKANTMGELHEVLHGMAFAIGGMVCHFDEDERSSIVIGLTQAIGMGLQLTSKSIGQPSNLEIVVGHK